MPNKKHPVDSLIKLAVEQLIWSSTLSVLIGASCASLSRHRLHVSPLIFDLTFIKSVKIIYFINALLSFLYFLQQVFRFS